MWNKVILAMTVAWCLAGGSFPALLFAASDAPTPTNKPSSVTNTHDTAGQSEMVSLIDTAPELNWTLRRYPSFYGDPNTVHGDLFTRSQLLGDVGGFRNTLVEHGIYIDVGITQFFGGNATGGTDNGSVRFNGSADYWLTVDTGKAGLWPGAALIAHAETSWEASDSISQEVGSLLPASFDSVTPVPGDSITTLPELYLVQGIPGNILLLAGKLNLLGLADTNVFANNERTQFGYTGLVVDPILGNFVPITPLSVGVVWTPNKQHSLTGGALQRDGISNQAGFDKFNGNYTFSGQYQFSPTILGRSGNYRVIIGYTTEEQNNFAISRRQLLGQVVGLVPISTKPNNYHVVGNFDQYVFVKGPSDRTGQPPIGIGLFGRAGWAPKGRNVIDQFYSVGLSGYGMLIPGRDHDRWGLGWAGTHISSDLRQVIRTLQTFEHAFEVFYNVEVTPAVHVTVNTQVVESAGKSRDTAVASGARLQVSF